MWPRVPAPQKTVSHIIMSFTNDLSFGGVLKQ